MHKNWSKTNFRDLITAQAAQRNIKDLTVGPVLSWNNHQIKDHIDAVLELEGA